MHVLFESSVKDQINKQIVERNKAADAVYNFSPREKPDIYECMPVYMCVFDMMCLSVGLSVHAGV